MTDSDPDECGTIYSLTAVKADTRLFLSHHDGNRDTEDVIILFKDIERRRSISSPIPVFISDNWTLFVEGLINVYGTLEQTPYKGIGRKPLPRLNPYEDLKYAQVCKKRVKGRVVEVVQRVVYGDVDEVLSILGADSGGCINTSYVECINLTIRNSLARFIRRGMNCSKNIQMHSRAIDFFQAWYNFVKPHKSLRIEINSGNRRWREMTPVMAEKLTDHIWTLGELMSFRIPIQ